MKQPTYDELHAENLRLREEIAALRQSRRQEQVALVELREELRLCRTLVEHAADAVFTGDVDGNITSANQHATTLTGYAQEELLGSNLGDFFGVEERARTPLRYDLLQAGKVVQYERRLTRKDGSLIPVWMNSRMLPDGTYHTFIRDNTERKAIEERLLTLVGDLEAFSYTVSHDLKTPLAAINGFVELLKLRCRQTLEPGNLELLERIEGLAENMLHLIENLLTIARTQQAERPAGPTDSDAVLAEVLAGLAETIGTVGASVETEHLPQLYVQPILLRQVLHNLIGNALLYGTPPGGVIRVVGEEQRLRVRLSVADQGAGVPKEEQEKIFGRHYRGRSAAGKSGSGLGLEIVSKIARAYGGTAGMENLLTGGSRFWVEFDNSPLR